MYVATIGKVSHLLLQIQHPQLKNEITYCHEKTRYFSPNSSTHEDETWYAGVLYHNVINK
jgi:hypothetical protein